MFLLKSGVFINMIKQSYIYRYQIKATGKYYIGKHNGNNKWYKGSGTDWLIDLKLHVKDPKVDLIEEILEYVNDISKLNEREEWWLQSVDATNNPLYYNKTNRCRGWTIVTLEQRKNLVLPIWVKNKVLNLLIKKEKK